MASTLGVLPGEVRHGMTLDDVLDLFDLWRDEPPVQQMVQDYLGYKQRPSEPPSTSVPAGAIPSIPFKP